MAPYWKPKAKFEGDLGPVYGVQWRRWKGYDIQSYDDFLAHHDSDKPSTTYFGAKVTTTEFDQIKHIIDTIKRNPTDRRMVLTAFNVAEIGNMALPPCHMFAQFYVTNNRELSCQVYIRSNDLFLGLPFNIASYALLVHMIAHVTDCAPGELIITIGDAHIYKNHINQVKEQLKRTPLDMPNILLNPVITDIDAFTMSDIVLNDYKHHPPISATMAV
jgi:thymidylate synthase